MSFEVSLFDVGRRALVPVQDEGVIEIRAEIPEGIALEEMPLEVARSLVVWDLMQRVLVYEGLSGRFVVRPFGSEKVATRTFGDFARRAVHRFEDEPEREARAAREASSIEVLLPGPRTVRPSRGDKQARGAPGAAKSSKARARPVTVGEVEEQVGRPALHIHLLSVHRSRSLPALRPGLREACARAERIREVAATLRRDRPSPLDMQDGMRAFLSALARDIDTPRAFSAMFDWLRQAELRREPPGDANLLEMLSLLGIEEVLDGVGGK